LTYWVSGPIALLAATGLLVGVVPTGGPVASASSLVTAMVRPVSATTFPHVARSRPVHLAIPALGISTTVVELGLQRNGQVMVPASVHVVGWFRYGPTPGQLGSSVILGHVDSYHGPGVFFRLKTLRAGHLIRVALADGAAATFAVTRVVQYPKARFPARLIYGSRAARSLNLVTCGGLFNRSTGHYESNIVVFSTLVGYRPARRPTT
jgi:sortase (surface protein transpeptidase)